MWFAINCRCADVWWQINLLDSKRSLNVNIFLRQFHQSLSAADIVNHLLTTTTHGGDDHGDEGRRRADAETLTCLLKIAPDDDEVQRLTAFGGDRRRLGVAERFLTELISLPKYVTTNILSLRLSLVLQNGKLGPNPQEIYLSPLKRLSCTY